MKRSKGDGGGRKVDTREGEGLTSNPFASLGGLREELPEQGPGAAGTASQERQVDTGPVPSAAPGRAVIRYQRKGRGGKEVTLVERLELSPSKLDHWLAEMKRNLGCGGVREGETLVLQGDQRERLSSWLQSRGVGKVSVS